MSAPLPRARWSGTFRLFGVTLHVHNLDDGRRIIDADDVRELLVAMAGDRGDGAEAPTAEELEAFARWQRGEATR